jgi:hypothetical protein
MSKIHIVKQGEHLSGIAAKYGFGDWHIVWKDGENAKLRAVRDPHVLFPGDKLFIPERAEKTEKGETAIVHTFEINIPLLLLRLRVLDLDRRPVAEAPCELRVKPVEVTLKKTDAKGIVEEEISNTLRDAELLVKKTIPPVKKGDDPRIEQLKFDLKVGDLNPETTFSGQQARLNNLGYFAGYTPDDIDQFWWAVEEFQCDKVIQGRVLTKPTIVPEALDDPAAETGVVLKSNPTKADRKTTDKLRVEHDGS